MINDFLTKGIGFDLFDSIIDRSIPNFPKYNMIKYGDDGEYYLELALAGYAKEDIKLRMKDSTLYISGSSNDAFNDDDKVKFFHRGITTKDFNVSFALGNSITVKSAEMNNGILSIYLVKEDKDDSIEIAVI